ncbi:hypothetical protein PENTCL1PPCAC_20542, partial [Pristionchus entomophagus]
DNVSVIEEYDGDRYSQVIEVGGLPWRLLVSRGDDGLSINLECMIKPSKSWRIKVDAEFILINSDISKNITSKVKLTISHSLDFSGPFPYILDDWEDLIDKDMGFIRDDQIIIEVNFSIIKMEGIKTIPRVDFTDPNEPRHDVTLIIEGEKIYASKQYLALNSPFFHALFYGNFNEKNKKEIELKDVNRDEFLEMLHTLYPSYRKISTDQIEYLLELGDRFQVAYVIDFVQKCINSCDLYLPDMPRIANQYGLKIDNSLWRGDIQPDMEKCVPPNEPVDFSDPNEPRHDVALVIGG